MAPLIAFYVLGGCIAAGVILFVVLIVLSIMGPPKLPVPGARGHERRRSAARVVAAILVTGTLGAAAVVAYPQARDAISQFVAAR